MKIRSGEDSTCKIKSESKSKKNNLKPSVLSEIV